MPKTSALSFRESRNIDSYLLGNAFAFGESFEALLRLSPKMDVKGHRGTIETLDALGRNWYSITLSLGTDDFDDIEEKCKSWSKYLFKKYRRRRHLTRDDADRIGRDFSGYRERYLLKLYSATVIIEAYLKVLNPSTLEYGPQKFFQPEVWNALSDGIKEDLSSAVVCLLVGEWTPSVMVGLRACEGAVREYYQFKTRRRLKKFKPWKALIDELLNRTDVSKTLLGHLDFIREKRNEAEHPGGNFTRDAAETTFIQVTRTVADVYDEMKDSSNPRRSRKSSGH